MNKKTLVKKGYTLSVTSWENDADNYQTHSETFETKEIALRVLEACQMCRSKHNNPQGVFGLGNMLDEPLDGGQEDMIVDYITKYNITSEYDEDDLEDLAMDLTHGLLGSSEYYKFRVFESAELFYSNTDITIDLLEIDDA